MTKKKKSILTVVIILVVLLAAGTVCWWIFLRGGTGGGSGGVYVQALSEVNCADGGYANRYSGIIETQQTSGVQLDSERTLGEVLVAEGDRVEVGQALFSYDTESTELEVQRAELEMERLNTTISNDNDQIAQLEKDMSKAASADKPGYSAQIQQLQAEVAQTQYDMKTKQAEIDKLKASLDNATVYAEMAGTVTKVADPESADSYSYDYSDSSNDFITIRADGDYRVKGSVSESNIYELYEGMTVIVRSRVHEDEYWMGTIASIDTQAESSSDDYYYSTGESASSYAFYVDLDSIDGLMLGQHVVIEPDYGQAEAKDGIWLSSGWITQDENGAAYVWAAKEAGARLEKRSVTLGSYDENMDEYEIVSGLDKGEYLAWPDEDCVVGAATTTEYVVPEEDYSDYYSDDAYYDDEVYYDDEEYYDEEAYSDEEEYYIADGEIFTDEDAMIDEGVVAEEAVG